MPTLSFDKFFFFCKFASVKAISMIGLPECRGNSRWTNKVFKSWISKYSRQAENILYIFSKSFTSSGHKSLLEKKTQKDYYKIQKEFTWKCIESL